MNRQRRGLAAWRSIAVLPAMLVAALGCAGGDAVAASKMYKCMIGNRTVYQQQACPVEAEASGSAASAGAPASAAHRRKLRSAEHSASSVPAKPR